MRVRLRAGILLACLIAAQGTKRTEARVAEDYPTTGAIERLDPAFDALVPKAARIEKLTDGFDWAEGPVWIRQGGFLLFSDIPKNAIWRWKDGEGKSIFIRPAGYTGDKPRGGESGSNGLLIAPDGMLVLCQHGDRRVAKRTADGRFVTLADRFDGKRLNSPNDAAFKSNGDLYFTDPPYGLVGGADDPQRELDFCGVYRLSKDGTLHLLTKEMSRPNGIAFSPDEKTLYVANSDPTRAVWMAYPVNDDGSIGSGRVFYDATSQVGKRKGLPDGMKVDKKGNLFATGPGGVWVFSPNGKHLGNIDPQVATANCGFGDDGSTLYLTADKSLCRIRLSTAGF